MSVTKKKDNEVVNWAKLHFSYSCDIILPLENAVTVMEQLKSAMSINTSSYDNHFITPYKEEISLSLLSHKEYIDLSTNKLLNPTEEEK